MKLFKQRVWSAIVLIIIVSSVVFYGTPFLFALLTATVVTLAIWEWTGFCQFKQSLSRFVITSISACLLLMFIFADLDAINIGAILNDDVEFILLAALIWWAFAFTLVVTYPKSSSLWGNSSLAKMLFALLTLMPFFASVLLLRLNNYLSEAHYGALTLIYLFSLVWCADTGAYIIGKKFGKTKLAPKISPKKTWQGVIGGLIFSALFALLFRYLAPASMSIQHLSIISFLLLSLATVIISMLGDLTESMFKRQAGIKDSGHFIPGHGGVLDRIDSLTAAVPFFTYFYFFV